MIDRTELSKNQTKNEFLNFDLINDFFSEYSI